MTPRSGGCFYWLTMSLFEEFISSMSISDSESAPLWTPQTNQKSANDPFPHYDIPPKAVRAEGN